MAEIELLYNGVKTIIECDINDKMKDNLNKFEIKNGKEIKYLYIFYDSDLINEESMEKTFSEITNGLDKYRKKLKLLVYEMNTNEENDNKIKSKEIICPICKENIRIKINNYKINLYECKNGHYINNILLNEFENSQYIDESEIKCDKCHYGNKFNSYDNKFYRCNICKINLCPLCKTNHKIHKKINYDYKNYTCEAHNERYIGYCMECKKNKCKYCLDEEIVHDIIDYNDLIMKNKNKKKEIKELNVLINRMNEDLNKIINKINNNINNKIIYNYFLLKNKLKIKYFYQSLCLYSLNHKYINNIFI